MDCLCHLIRILNEWFLLTNRGSKENYSCSFFEGIDIHVLVNRGKKSACLHFQISFFRLLHGFQVSRHNSETFSGYVCVLSWRLLNCRLLQTNRSLRLQRVLIACQSAYVESLSGVKTYQLNEARRYLPVVRSENSLLTDTYVIFNEKLRRIC